MFRCVTKQIECNMFVCCVFFFVLFALLLFKNASTFALYKNSQIMVIHKVLFWKVFYVDQREKKA